MPRKAKTTTTNEQMSIPARYRTAWQQIVESGAVQATPSETYCVSVTGVVTERHETVERNGKTQSQPVYRAINQPVYISLEAFARIITSQSGDPTIAEAAIESLKSGEPHRGVNNRFEYVP